MKRTRIDKRIKDLQEQYKPKIKYEMPEGDFIEKFECWLDMLTAYNHINPNDSTSLNNCNLLDILTEIKVFGKDTIDVEI